MGLKFDPVGGGQFKQAVAAMIEVEKQPIKGLEARKAKEEAKLKLFQDFKSRFTDLQRNIDEISSFKRLREIKVDLGDGVELASVTVDKEKAQPGTYEITVEEAAGRAGVISNGFENPDAPVLGTGYVRASGPNGDIQILVDDKNASLRGIANAVNSDRNSPISAEVIRDDWDPEKPYRLILKSKTDGTVDSAEIPELYFVGGKEDIYVDDDRSAKNAVLKVDGFEIETRTNDIKDFVEGVNLSIKGARPDKPFRLTLTVDTEKVSGKVKGVVDQINKVLEFITKQNQVDQSSDTSTMFTGDTGLQGVEYRIRNLFHEGFPSNDDPDHPSFRWMHLNELGIEFSKEGSLKFDGNKFKKALDTDFDGVATALAGEMGFARQVGQVMGMYSRPGDGLLAMRETGMRSRIRRIDDDIAKKETQLQKKTDALVGQYSRLQSTLGNLQRQGQYMQSQLGSAGGGGNLVSQLLGG